MSFIIKENKQQDVFKKGYFDISEITVFRASTNKTLTFQADAKGESNSVSVFEAVKIDRLGNECSRIAIDSNLINLDTEKEIFILNEENYNTSLELYGLYFYEFSSPLYTYKSQVFQVLFTDEAATQKKGFNAFIYPDYQTQEKNKTGYRLINFATFNFDAARFPTFQFPANGTSTGITSIELYDGISGKLIADLVTTYITLNTTKDLFLSSGNVVEGVFGDGCNYFLKITNGINAWYSQVFNTYGEAGIVITFDSTLITFDSTEYTFDNDI